MVDLIFVVIILAFALFGARRGFFGAPLQKRIRFLKFRKFRIPKQTRLRAFVLLLQPSMKPLDQGTSMEFRIS